MLNIKKLSFSIGGSILFNETSVNIPTGQKVGIVGRNGTGKTSLFKLIRNEWTVDSGLIEIPRHFRIGGVEQEAPATNDSLIETVMQHDKERTSLLAEAESATDPNRIAEIQIRLVDIDAYSAEARASIILSGLGFDNKAQLRPCHEFSGGWRMRVALGGVLFSNPDILLLDEPTNYLDLEGAIWLENFLAKYKNTILVISHDRELLNRAVTGILHLTDKKLNYYSGNYDQFDKERRMKLEQLQSLKRKQDNQRAHIQSFVDRFKAKASKAKQAQSRMKQLEKMEPIIALSENTVASFQFNASKELPPPLVSIDKGSVGYNGVPVLKNLNLRLDQDDRIALLGANGEGKSTLSKLIADRIKLIDGKHGKSNKLKVGFFAQHQLDELVRGETPLQHMMRLKSSEPIHQLRARLGSAGIDTNIANTKVELLSGGQKARLLMIIAAIEDPHILILDEPTNHLDIESREALVLALNQFQGAVILVSHDSHLVEMVADRLWLVQDGEVNSFHGDMDEYKKMLLSSKSVKAEKKINKIKLINTDIDHNIENISKPTIIKKKRNTSLVKRLISDCEKNILQLEKDKARIEKKMNDPDFYSGKNISIAKKASKRHAELVVEIEIEEKSWSSLLIELEDN
jgi:ATP-binding cassette subfamily F protein 3